LFQLERVIPVDEDCQYLGEEDRQAGVGLPVGRERQVVHHIFDDEKHKPDAFCCCHLVGTDQGCGKLDAVESLRAVKHHPWQEAYLNTSMLTWT